MLQIKNHSTLTNSRGILGQAQTAIKFESKLGSSAFSIRHKPTYIPKTHSLETKHSSCKVFPVDLMLMSQEN